MSRIKDEGPQPKLKPSQFLRARRPEQFSDSKIVQQPSLDRSYLDYMLNSLTSRSEEKQFEHLVRKLVERLICPNLIPQTGPTGGGDSKVDTETYPVHPDIAALWYEGDVTASNERWGFAISAKKQWQGKIRSDMESIASTGRPYKVVYFASSQFISDKSKANFQDELTKKHGFEVRILDRTWLLEAILEKGNQDVAAQTLDITGIAPSSQVGPNDHARKQDLEDLEDELKDNERYRGVEHQKVEDCLQAAILSRELELPRHITEGRLERAIRVAKQYGDGRQIANAVYQKAWTSVYWHDDFSVLLETYNQVETFALSSRNSQDVEKSLNLWQTLHSGVLTGEITEVEAKLQERYDRLTAHLESLSTEADRPNNAANSRGWLIMLRLVRSAHVPEARERLLREFGDLLESSQRLGTFEFERQYEIFEVLEEPFGHLEVYDEVFERILPVIEGRRSEIVVADKLFNRGISKLRSHRIYEAIDLLGRALPKLMKAEKKERLVRCLAALASAYAAVDLHWAAHASQMSALATLLRDLVETRRVDPFLPMLLDRIFWNEVSLGRVPQALWALQLQISLLQQTTLSEDRIAELEEELQNKSGVLAMLLLKADEKQLNEFVSSIGFLEDAGLFACAMALLFSFGGPEYLRKYEYIPSTESDSAVWDLMKTLWGQPAQEKLPTRIETMGSSKAKFLSVVLGVRWEVTCENNPWCIRIAESYLAFIEAFLATSFSHNAFGVVERLKLNFALVDEKEACPNEQGVEMVVDRIGAINVRIWPSYFPVGALRTDALRTFFMETLPTIIPRVLMPQDMGIFLEKVAREEDGLNRSLLFADVLASSSNIFPNCESPKMSEWDDEDRSYEIVASPPCNVALQTIMSLQALKKAEPFAMGQGDPPPEVLDSAAFPHGRQRVLSIIDSDLWAQAQWQGVGTVVQPGNLEVPPFLCLLFRDEAAAEKIFQSWIEEVGRVDKDERIRLVILTGVDKSSPSSYTLSIGSNVSQFAGRPLDRVLVTSRVKTMENPDPRNLARFRSAFASAGTFILAPAVITEPGAPPEVHFDLGIRKSSLEVREAWRVGRNDLDAMAIRPEMDPIVPEGEENVPVLGLLEWLRRDR